MSMRRLLYAWPIIALGFFTSSPSYAQRQLYQYATKFVCGQGDGVRTVKGNYLTVVNIHNPGLERMSFAWKVAVALPLQGNQPVSSFTPAGLISDGAGDIICKQIVERAAGAGPVVTGFVVVESPVPLDVVAVYTATDPSGASITMNVLPTTMRLIPWHKW